MFKLFELKKDKKGQSMIEFALIFPILLVFILGIVQFGIFLSAHIAVTNAAREGARAAVVGTPLGTPSGEESYDTVYKVVDRSLGAHNYIKGAISINAINNTEENLGNPITVTINGLYVDTIVPIPTLGNNGFGDGNLIDSDYRFDVIGEAVMRHEYSPPDGDE